MKGRIDVVIHERGYTTFTVDGRRVLAYQSFDGQHYLIPTERPAQTLSDPLEATKHITRILREEGGDVTEFINRPNNPFQFPN